MPLADLDDPSFARTRCVALAIKPGRSLRRELRRIACKELGNASERLLKRNRNDEDVHEGRKSVKKAEAIANLLDQLGPPVRARDRDDLHAAKRALSRLRDVDAVIGTFDRLRSRFLRRIPRATSTRINTHLRRRKAGMRPAIRSGAGSLARTGRDYRRSSVAPSDGRDFYAMNPNQYQTFAATWR
jgi:hypothetical protein